MSQSNAFGHTASPLPANAGKKRFLRRLGFALGLAAGLMVLLGVLGDLWVRHRLTADLPQTSGQWVVSGLTAPVSIERDALGIPTLAGGNRRDVAFATGFVHAQDRFFQMDLLRRRSAGELSELFGPATVQSDLAIRVHLFREHARRVLAASAPELREVLTAYTDGVNAGLSALDSPPFEYLVLRCEPQPWKAEDSVLVLFTMFSQLEDIDAVGDANMTLMHDRLPEDLFRFLNPPGSEWDTPVAGTPPAPTPLPGPEVFDLRRGPHAADRAGMRGNQLPAAESAEESPRLLASSSWAVAGRFTANGAALLANELHLSLSVPNVWYRVSLSWPKAAGSGRHAVTGATLPGAPAVVVGSNGRLAWSLTNSMLDTSDIVLLDVDPRQPGRYQTPSGPQSFVRHQEIVKVKGEPDRRLSVDWTIWGPVQGKDAAGRTRVVRAAVDEEGAADFEILRLETADRLEQALDVANRSGVPALNFLSADSSGRIGWTIAGRLPRRAGFDGELATSWADGTHRWDGLLPPAEVPRVVDPESGRLWTANNLVLAGDPAAPLGRGQFALGARARQIRDDLLALPRADVDAMRRIQLDDRALFLQRWHDLLLQVLTPETMAAHPGRRELRDLVERWGARASVDSAGYRMVRAFRVMLTRDVFEPLTEACRKADPKFSFVASSTQYEAPLWQLVTRQPLHLLNPKYKSWNEQLLGAADEVVDSYAGQGRLADRTWGERNTTAIDHPMSGALPVLGRWLSMPPLQLPGDDDMPRVQRPDFGATLRMVVSPGHEKEAIFQMPGGESGNPISTHYGDSYAAWAEGTATPFLPGTSSSRLELLPGAERAHRQ